MLHKNVRCKLLGSGKKEIYNLVKNGSTSYFSSSLRSTDELQRRLQKTQKKERNRLLLCKEYFFRTHPVQYFNLACETARQINRKNNFYEFSNFQPYILDIYGQLQHYRAPCTYEHQNIDESQPQKSNNIDPGEHFSRI